MVFYFNDFSPSEFADSFKDTYDFGLLFSSEFYNADFNTLIELDSEEIYSTSLGLVISNNENKSYSSLEFRMLRNYSDRIELQGYSFYSSVNHNVLTSSKRHLFYPKIGLGIDKYALEFNEDIIFEGNNLLSENDKL